jgi:aquaporin Z
MSLTKRAGAEFLGTFFLVFAGCGSALLAATLPGIGVGILGVSLAFGLALLTLAYALGPISGCHLNPAVSVGLTACRRFPASDLVGYILAQVAGAILAAAVLYMIANGKPGGLDLSGGFTSNGYGIHSPGGYALIPCLLMELLMTFMFVFIVLGAMDRRTTPQGFPPIPIGLALALANLVAIPITNASINPARSTGPALIVGGWAVEQLWLFWLAPIAGGAIAGWAYYLLSGERQAAAPVRMAA